MAASLLPPVATRLLCFRLATLRTFERTLGRNGNPPGCTTKKQKEIDAGGAGKVLKVPQGEAGLRERQRGALQWRTTAQAAASSPTEIDRPRPVFAPPAGFQPREKADAPRLLTPSPPKQVSLESLGSRPSVQGRRVSPISWPVSGSLVSLLGS